MKESGKFMLEVQSLLLNLKISAQEYEKNPENKQNLDAFIESINQLIDISGLYGMNSVLQYVTRIAELVNMASRSDAEINNEVAEYMSTVEPLLRDLINDPLFENDDMKKKFQASINKANQLLKQLGTDMENDSGKVTASKFQEVFIEEAFDLINQLEEKMLQLESDPSDMTMIDYVFRIMHTLKGNSNMFGYANLAEITHELENIYDSVRDKKLEFSHKILENTLHCIDHFRNLINDPELSNVNVLDQHRILVTDIKSILQEDPGEGNDNMSAARSKIASELHYYYIFFKPERDIFDDGTNPLYFVQDLHEMGTCLVIPVFDNALTEQDYDPEKCYTSWHILLATTGTEEDVREHFLFLRESSQPRIKILTAGNLLNDEKFVGQFTGRTTNQQHPVEFDMQMYAADDGIKQQGRTEVKESKESIASVRVASQKIDQMMNLISELVTKQAELSMLVTGNGDQKLIEVAESIENISRDLRDNAFSISLIPLEKSVLRFQRLVRDVASRFEKKIDFVIEGKETELDKTLIEKIVDPIMHILRNSIDHGIEKPKERLKKGKPATGTIILKAYPSGAHVVIEISDDGAGINLDKVKETAIRKGMIGQNETIGRDELLHLIVSPGFSTAENISEVSGRGVGMDVVNQKIAEIRGELEIYTEKDKGTTITIKLPLTISIIDSLLLKVAGDYYLAPLSVVERCAEIKEKDLEISDNSYVVLDGEYVPFIDMRKEFFIESERPPVQQILLVKYKDILVGLVVDEVIGNYQAVLKALGDAYKRQEIISGASILGSGEIALVLDTNKIIQEFAARNELKVNAMA